MRRSLGDTGERFTLSCVRTNESLKNCSPSPSIMLSVALATPSPDIGEMVFPSKLSNRIRLLRFLIIVFLALKLFYRVAGV